MRSRPRSLILFSLGVVIIPVKLILNIPSLLLFALLPVNGGTLTKGALSADGKLILYVEGVTPILLDSEFGLMVFNEGDAEAPKPRLEVAVRADSKIYTFYTVPEFATFLDRLPPGSKLHLYDRCTTSTAYKLPKAIWREVRVTCSRRKIILAKPHITCICVG